MLRAQAASIIQLFVAIAVFTLSSRHAALNHVKCANIIASFTSAAKGSCCIGMSMGMVRSLNFYDGP